MLAVNVKIKVTNERCTIKVYSKSEMVMRNKIKYHNTVKSTIKDIPLRYLFMART